MKRFSTGLPFKYRLDIHLIKRRGVSREEESLIPSLKTVARTRSGSKISRYFRHIFEHKHIRRILGGQFALFIAVSAFIPVSASTFEPTEPVIINSESVQIKTERHIQYPLEKIEINQGYHFFHPGIDFEGKTGELVYAIMAGEVAAVQYSGFAYGNAILLRHGDNYSSLYAHLSKINVTIGQKVYLSTILGEVGSSGRSSGDHLHLEIRENGHQINPLVILPRT
jgi:murein DD-endopeptidase MepM/ murein hydrolase activator NlpD